MRMSTPLRLEKHLEVALHRVRECRIRHDAGQLSVQEGLEALADHLHLRARQFREASNHIGRLLRVKRIRDAPDHIYITAPTNVQKNYILITEKFSGKGKTQKRK